LAEKVSNGFGARHAVIVGPTINRAHQFFGELDRENLAAQRVPL
jgi:hypothetical protein